MKFDLTVILLCIYSLSSISGYCYSNHSVFLHCERSQGATTKHFADGQRNPSSASYRNRHTPTERYMLHSAS